MGRTPLFGRTRAIVFACGVAIAAAGAVMAEGGPGGSQPKVITCHANCGGTVVCDAGLAACCCPAGQPPTYTCACSNAQGDCTASNCELTY